MHLADSKGRSVRFAERTYPHFELQEDGDAYAALSLEQLLSSVPTFDERKRILAQDPLASADGFRVLLLLTYRFLFGMNVCKDCPHCNHADRIAACQDLFGSSATPEGGIFGRVDAGFTSIEAQKATGALHAHAQLSIQCLHQHTRLHAILKLLRERQDAIVSGYLEYKAHVRREDYAEKN